jgi:pimeloyl-ACP methyl ester carboxylesterase
VSRFWLQIIAAAVFVLAWTQSAALDPRHESGVLPIDPPTPYHHYFGVSPPAGRVLVVHGLDTSNDVMWLISAAIADAGFDVYAIDLPGHGDSAAPFQTNLAQQAIHNAKEFLGEQTIVLGHSLGAGLLLDMADTERFGTMVLLAPPPLSIERIQADRVLIATGAMDIPRIRSFVAIATDIGEPHVESWLLPWGLHSAPILNPGHIRRIVTWLGGDASKVRTQARIFWIVLMFVASVAVGVLLLPGRKVEPAGGPAVPVLVMYIVACGLALLLLKAFNPFGWIRLFAADYLIGFLFITGMCLTAAALHRGRGEIIRRPCHLPTAILAAAYVVAVPGFLVLSRILHIGLSNGRWWRFPIIALACLPLFLCDEITIRRIRRRWKSEVTALLTRGMLLAFILTGVLTLNRESSFLVLIVPLIVIFWIGLWLAAGVVHRHTQSPVAAALFAAVVQGWAFAAWFVTI